jgi:LmbE family N-acetylglucosaminyl deacetylase
VPSSALDPQVDRLDLAGATLVVAHPDDEVLWFSSLAEKVAKIIIVYGAVSTIPERAEQRRRVIEAYPLAGVEFLDIPEPGPVGPDFAAPHAADLHARLAPRLAAVKTVFTHNPWGEYGHADHKRVSGVVAELAAQRPGAFDVYVSCYVARHRLMEFNAAIDGGFDDIVSFPVDPEIVNSIFELYKASGCWTWARNWNWPACENFVRLCSDAPLRATPLPMHVFDVKF